MPRLERDQLPQIPKEELEHFIDYCRQRGVFTEKVDIPVRELKAIQKHVNRAKVDSIKKKIEKHEKLPPLLVSADYYIMDGHHRWIAEKELNPQMKYPCIRFKCPITKLVELGHTFDGSFIKSIHEATIYYQELIKLLLTNS